MRESAQVLPEFGRLELTIRDAIGARSLLTEYKYFEQTCGWLPVLLPHNKAGRRSVPGGQQL